MTPPVPCARRCGAVADDAQTALSAGWEHIPPDWWVCAACEAADAAASVTADDAAPDAARERGR